MTRPAAFRFALAAPALIFTTACQQDAGAAPEYPAGEAGNVGQAMCLLGFTAVPLREVATGHHLVDATLNGQTASFVLDTGANVTAIDQERAEQFGLSAQPGGLRGMIAGGRTNAAQVPIESLSIGPVEIRQRSVVLAGLGQLLTALGQAAGEEVAGIIGQDVLAEHHAIIDVAQPMLYLSADEGEPTPVPVEQCRNQN